MRHRLWNTIPWNQNVLKNKNQAWIGHSVSLRCSSGVHTYFPGESHSPGGSQLSVLEKADFFSDWRGRQVIPSNQILVFTCPQSLAQGLVWEPARVNEIQDSWQGFLRETCVHCSCRAGPRRAQFWQPKGTTVELIPEEGSGPAAHCAADKTRSI